MADFELERASTVALPTTFSPATASSLALQAGTNYTSGAATTSIIIDRLPQRPQIGLAFPRTG